MRRLVPLTLLLAGCQQSSAETVVAFALIFGTLIRILVDPDAR
jgi:hypothetical protein